MKKHYSPKIVAGILSAVLAFSYCPSVVVRANEDIAVSESATIETNTQTTKGADSAGENKSGSTEKTEESGTNAAAKTQSKTTGTDTSSTESSKAASTEGTNAQSTVKGTTDSSQSNSANGVKAENTVENASSTVNAETDTTKEITANNTSTGQETETEEAVTTYDEFLGDLKILSDYADSYVQTHTGVTANALMINYIRTGVERYTTDSWKIMAGPENTDFVNYVAEQDKEKGTTASALRNIHTFKLVHKELTNGELVDFEHMFGMMDIASYNGDVESATSDMGGWAGDLVDLVTYVHNNCAEVSSYNDSNIDDFADLIENKYLHVDTESEDSFGDTDIYGDLDGYYVMKQLAQGGRLYDVVENYFTEDLTDANRAAYFLNTKFSGKTTKDDIRSAILTSYESNKGCALLEADRNLNSLSEIETLRKGCAYAFADYLYGLAKNMLNPTVDPTDPDTPDTPTTNDFYTVFSDKQSTLAPGVTQNIKYATTVDNKQIVYYLATADLSNKDVHVYANYGDNDGSQVKTGKMTRVSDQMAAAQKKHSNPEDSENYIENYSTIAGINADFYNMSTGIPTGILVMNGTVYNDAKGYSFFGIKKDGTPVIGDAEELTDDYKSTLQEAVGAASILVKDGKMAVSISNNYYNTRASRTAVGITADNKVVFMVLDGRQEPFSAGGSAEEIAQIMLDAGCVQAVALDGGGSSTFVAKEEGSDSCEVVNRPSDGYERSVSSSLMIVSTAETTNAFDHAAITTDKDYLSVGTKINFSVSGVSSSGNTADLPEDLTFQLSDAEIGTLDGKTFTAEKTGDVEIQAVSNGKVVASKELHVVVPDKLGFKKAKIQAVYGVGMPLPIEGYYDGNPVAINENDVTFTIDPETAGVINDLQFVGDENSGVRVATVKAALKADGTVTASTQISLYKNGEAIFDFDNATESLDDGAFAWDRDVSNSTSTTTEEDGTVYHIKDPKQSMDISYVFAFDMSSVKIPDKLKPLVSLLPGGDSDSATAWQFLLQLAERVSVKTSVSVEFNMDPNLDIDYSNLRMSNEYFTMTGKSYDESTHKLTITCNWVDQTEAIDRSTANPICILSGLKATPAEDAKWDENNQLAIKNTGDFGYNIYLRSNTLHSVASSPQIQEQYGVYPFENTDIIINGETEKGGRFSSTVLDFEDKFTLDRTDKEGWQKIDDNWYYFENNAALTGIHQVPGLNDESNTYYYKFDDNGISQGKVSGLFEMDGDLYFAKNGILQGGWQSISNGGQDVDYYFFNTWSHKALDGEQTIGGYHYIFKNHILVRGDLVTRSDGNLWYMWAGSWASQRWATIDGNDYYFRSSYNAAKGIYSFNINNENRYYVFGQDGVWQKDLSGLWDDTDGNTYLVKNGVIEKFPGLVEIDGYYYYFQHEGHYYAVKNRTYWISKTNGLLKEGNYTFDEKGRIVFNGWFTDNNGTTWYNEKGERQYFSTWATIDGKDYYFDAKGYVIKGVSEKMTGKDGVTEAQFVFDTATGAFLSEQNGLYNSGKDTYWTKDGMIVEYAGLVKVTTSDGAINYYYFGEDNKAVKNLPADGPDQWIPVDKTNGLLPSWGYHFDENGVILHNSDTTLNGFATVDGVKMYFINGVPAPMGMITVDGDTYYVTSKGIVITGRSYYCSILHKEDEKQNFPIIATEYKEGTYTFDADGKMVTSEAPKNGIYSEDGSLYYYKDGVRTYGGVMKIDGAYYYAATSGEIVHAAAGQTRKYWISKTNGLVPEKSYVFDENGKMEVPDESKTGIYSEDGSLYYYVKGVRTYGGVMKIDGAYYYAATSGEIVHAAAGQTRKYWISKTNDLLSEKSYTFDENGKILDAVEKKDTSVNGIVSEDGSLYYYKNGLRYYAGVFEQDGKLYYAATSGEIVHASAGQTRKYWISKTNGLLKEKSYTFDENGVILDGKQ